MFRYKLRTLLIVLALGPAVLAGGWWALSPWFAHPMGRYFIAWLSVVFGLIAVVCLMAILPPRMSRF